VSEIKRTKVLRPQPFSSQIHEHEYLNISFDTGAFQPISDFWHRFCVVVCSNRINGDPAQVEKDKGVPLRKCAVGRLFILQFKYRFSN
jgi:hypothetical protein